MIVIEISEATSKEIVKRIKLSLPEYAWQILQARAKTCYGGNINKCVEEMFRGGLFPWIMESIKSTSTLS